MVYFMTLGYREENPRVSLDYNGVCCCFADSDGRGIQIENDTIYINVSIFYEHEHSKYSKDQRVEKASNRLSWYDSLIVY